MSVTVDELLKNPFAVRNMEDKLNIVRDGKPRPPLKMSAVTINETDGSMLTKHFDFALYNLVDWLTGCNLRGSVFCWPCLLFKPTDVWSTVGISDLILLEEGMPTHEKSPNHIEAVANLNSFMQHNTKATIQKQLMRNEQEYEQIQRNREVIKLLIEAACGLILRDIPTRFKRKSWCRFDIEQCVKTLQFLQIYNTPYTNHIEEAIDLIKINPDILDDVAESLTEILKIAIKKDMMSSTYVSIIISEHSESCNSSQISTILRYLKGGEVHERYIGLSNMGKRCTPAGLYNHVAKVVHEFEFKNRFLALSVDGGVLKTTDELNHLIFQLKTDYPHSYFVPCYFHGLHHVLQQSLYSFKECLKFFKTFSALETFFQTDSNHWKAFESFMAENIPGLKYSNNLKEMKFLKLVNIHRLAIIQFCSSLEQNSKFWGNNDVAKASGFKHFLEDFQTVFLLKVFTQLFEHTNTLETSLRSRTPENAFGTGIITMVIGDLALEKDEGFNNIWPLVNKEVIENEESPHKKPRIDDATVKLKYRALFSCIFQRAIAVIQTRFKTLNVLQFCRLLTLVTSEKSTNNNLHPKSYRGDSLYNDYLQRLMDAQRPFFDEEQLRNEIAALRLSSSTLFCEKSDYDLLKIFTEMKLQDTFKNLHRLSELILTMPFRMPGIPNKLEKIVNFSYTPEKIIAPGDISMLSIEKDLIQYIKRDIFFYDEVLNKFNEINGNKRMEIIQN